MEKIEKKIKELRPQFGLHGAKKIVLNNTKEEFLKNLAFMLEEFNYINSEEREEYNWLIDHWDSYK